MKKLFFIQLVTFLFVSMTSCHRVDDYLYFLSNETGKELVIYPPMHYEGEDSTILAPNEYFKIGTVQYVYSYGVRPENFYYQDHLYISMDGVVYCIDRNDRNNCLWTWSYQCASDEEMAKLLYGSYDGAFVFRLTEDYIKRQIVVE